MPKLAPETDWLRADAPGTAVDPAVRVDRGAGVIYGHVLAEKGPFKSKGRGEFDDLSLDRIVELAALKRGGLKSRFAHPGLSADGLGKFLGRDRNVRRDGDKVRGDLHLDRTALDTPPAGGKPLGQYVMDLAQSDPDAFGSSLVLKCDKEYRLASDGKSKKTDDRGDPLPPLWRPTALHAIDMVDDGDAVHGGFLSVGDPLPDAVVRRASELLNEQFAGCDRATLRARCLAYLDRYSDLRFGPDDAPEDDDMAANTDPTPVPNPTDPKPPVTAVVPAPAPPNPPAPKSELSAEVEEQLRVAARRVVAEELAKAKADAEAALAAVKAQGETYRREREAEDLAAAHARIDREVDEALDDGRLSPAADAVAPGRLTERQFLKTLNWRDPVPGTESEQGGRKLSKTQLDLALEKLAGAERPKFRESIPGSRGEQGARAEQKAAIRKWHELQAGKSGVN